MKNQYEKPVMVAETFTPNNFVSSCDPDLWKGVANSLPASITIYYDYPDPDWKYDNGELLSVNSQETVYFKMTDNSNFINMVDQIPSSLINVNDRSNFYKDKDKQNRYRKNQGDINNLYTSDIFTIQGAATSSTSGKYWYSSKNFTFSKSAS